MEGYEDQQGESIVSSLIKEVSGLGAKLKLKNEDEEFSPFEGIEKAQVLQEARKFDKGEFVKKKPHECRQIITQLLYLLYQNEKLSPDETTRVFFGCTKLFQSNDANLRRMVYLFIKELAIATQADEVIIVIQSLVKDMTSSDTLFIANAIRVLSKIVDTQFLTSIDRYFKQSIVNKNPVVASAALVSGMHLAKDSGNADVVRRWVSEVNESLNTSNDMVQYHALRLLYDIRKHDTHAVAKVVLQLSRSMLKSPLAMCQLVKYACSLLKQEDLSTSNKRTLLDFLDSCLRHKHEMVIYEAARAMCKLPDMTQRELSPAITVLQMFLSSSKPALRFAAVRTLNQVAMAHPDAVMKCNDEMESLINDANRSIATLALTTLLKTGSESSIERLMKQISTFMNEIGDEFKIVVVKAIHALCLKFPKKHPILLMFLSSTLREEGGFDFKKTIVDTMLGLIEELPASKEIALYHLCEFIEDCEYVSLSTRVLHLLGELATDTAQPAKFIRFVFNRVILEKAPVRAAAVSALAKFGAKVEDLRPSVVMLLKRCLSDDDNEVRDRATTLVRLLSTEPFTDVQRQFILTSNDQTLLQPKRLRRQLEMYFMRPAAGVLSYETLPQVAMAIAAPDTSFDDSTASGRGLKTTSSKTVASELAELYQVPEFADLGSVFKTCATVKLSESEAEYVVSCDKHIFAEAIVFQFRIVNTINDCLLEDVRVEMVTDEEEFWEEEKVVIPVEKARYNTPATGYVMMRRAADAGVQECAFTCELLFVTKDVDCNGEVDPDDEGEEDQFPLEEIEVEKTDFITKIALPSFRPAWEQLGAAKELVQKFGFSGQTVADTVGKVIQILGLGVCEGTGAVGPDDRAHMVLLAGMYLGGIKVLVRGQVQQTKDGKGCVLKMAVRSQSDEVNKFVVACIEG